MTEKEYRSHPAISRSELWRIRESPEKFKWHKENPQSDITASLLFGQVVHKLLLQPDTFDQDFTIAPNVDRRTKAGREAYDAFSASVGERTIVSADDYRHADEMVRAAMSIPFVQKLLDGGREMPFFWTDDDTGEQCKCRCDCLTRIGDRLLIIDYKTAKDASTDAFQRDAIRHGYHFQSAMYSAGVEKNEGTKPRFVFIVQEKNPPYSVNILEADEAFIANGYNVFRELIGTYHYCKDSGNWYGYMGRDGIINTLALPAWLSGDSE